MFLYNKRPGRHDYQATIIAMIVNLETATRELIL